MWVRFSRRTRRPSAVRSPHFRPQVDVLENRCLLSAGALDTTFGNGAGYVNTNLIPNQINTDVAYSVLIQPDGKILAVGDAEGRDTRGRLLTPPEIGLVRYNPNGSLDSSFGNAGVVIGPASVYHGQGADFIHAALYPPAGTGNDGKIVVGGLAGGFSIARYNANGSLDTSFGAKGIATANFGSTSSWDVIFEVIQPDGKIVALGQTADDTQSQLARFNADGSLDSTFQGGMVTGPVVNPFSLLLQADGKLVVVGTPVNGGSGGLELARYNTNGTLDASFGNGGVVINSSFGTAYQGAIYPTAGTPNDGKILVEGNEPSHHELARYNPDGSLDSTFGNGGLAIGPPVPGTGGGNIFATQGPAIQPDGRIVVAGGGPGHTFGTARYNSDGSLDTSFGSRGSAGTWTGGNSTTDEVALQPNGAIVAAGWGYNGSNVGFVVARFLGGPTSGPAFSVTGLPSSTTAGVAQTITVTAEGASGTVTAADASGNPNPGYTGTVHFTSSDPQAVLPADYTFTAADQGVHTFTVTLKTVGNQSFNITDEATGYSGGDGAITINPAAASSFVLRAFPASIIQGTAATFTVTAMDPYGNVATGYTGTVTFGSSDPLASVPGNYTFTAADAGIHTFSATLNTVGTESLTATDILDTSITGTETGISVTRRKH
jgi:uncharacterized delta-60 repeat protein